MTSSFYLNNFLNYLFEYDIELNQLRIDSEDNIDLFDSYEDWSLLKKYIFLVNHLESKPYDPSDVCETIIEWYCTNDEVITDLSDMNPYYLMKNMIDDYGSDVLEDRNPAMIQTMAEMTYERTEISQEAVELQKEFDSVIGGRIIKLQKAVKKFIYNKYLQKTKVHHLSRMVLGYL